VSGLRYVLKHWSKHLQPLDFIDDRAVGPQNVIVATQSVPSPGPDSSQPVQEEPLFVADTARERATRT
jgi:hypothetical protein